MRGRMRDMAQHPGGHHGHRQRARRGAIKGAVVRLLGERPMHGYELIGELEERTGGRWRPSPGSVYPTLAALEDEGLIQAVAGEADDKKRFELTDTGRSWLDEHGDDPFVPGRPGGPDGDRERGFGFGGFGGFGGPGGFGGRGELRRLGGEIVGQLRQIARFGTPGQLEQAQAILATARTELYQVLAAPPATEEPADESTDTES